MTRPLFLTLGLLVFLGLACAGGGVRTHVGGENNNGAITLQCSGDCVAWEVAQDPASQAAISVASKLAGATWVPLSSGASPPVNQYARCAEFSKSMADVCKEYLGTPTKK